MKYRSDRKKPDLSGVRKLTPAELAERLHLRAQGKEPSSPRKVRGKPRRKRIKEVYSVTVLPELRNRAAREIGDGNFSRAVTKALKRALIEIDRLRLNLPDE